MTIGLFTHLNSDNGLETYCDYRLRALNVALLCTTDFHLIAHVTFYNQATSYINSLTNVLHWVFRTQIVLPELAIVYLTVIRTRVMQQVKYFLHEWPCSKPECPWDHFDVTTYWQIKTKCGRHRIWLFYCKAIKTSRILSGVTASSLALSLSAWLSRQYNPIIITTMIK